MRSSLLSLCARRRLTPGPAGVAITLAGLSLLGVACSSPAQAKHRATPTAPVLRTAPPTQTALDGRATASAVATPAIAASAPATALPTATEAPADPAVAEATAETPALEPEAPPSPPPARVIVPRIGVNARVIPVGEDPDGAMSSPGNPYDVGWWERGSRPGDYGSAVLGGHVDFAGFGAAVFWDLHLLQPGDTVSVVSTEGRQLNFTVTEVATYRWDDRSVIPRIYQLTDHQGLNLITCAGAFDARTHNYDKRVVVYTTLSPGQ